MSEYLSRRDFNKRVVLGGLIAGLGGTDALYNGAGLIEYEMQSQQATKEVIENGTPPPSLDNKTRKPEEFKVQQQEFYKAVQENLDKRTDRAPSVLGLRAPSLLRVAGDSGVMVKGLEVVFNAMFMKKPS